MTAWYWSVLLAGFGLIGLYLAGRNSYWGWAVGLVDEVLWAIYAVQTRQWAFCLSALAYGWVYTRNLRSWLQLARVQAITITPIMPIAPVPPVAEPDIRSIHETGGLPPWDSQATG